MKLTVVEATLDERNDLVTALEIDGWFLRLVYGDHCTLASPATVARVKRNLAVLEAEMAERPVED